MPNYITRSPTFNEPSSIPDQPTLRCHRTVSASSEELAYEAALSEFMRNQPNVVQIHESPTRIEQLNTQQFRVTVVFSSAYPTSIRSLIHRWRAAFSKDWTISLWEGESLLRRVLCVGTSGTGFC